MEKTSNSLPDNILLLTSLVVLGGGIFGFYAYEAQVSTLWRALALVGVVIVSLVIAYQSTMGKNIIHLIGQSRTEVRKMVWPNRQEIIQLTITVVIAVVLVSIFLWLLDTLFLWLTELIVGR